MKDTDTERTAASAQPVLDEARLLAELRNGNEAVFAQLVAQYSGSLLRVASMYVQTRAAAEEVVQETWMGVLEGLDRFEGRSSFKTWLFRILTNRAKTRGEREGRYVPFPSAGGETASGHDEPAVDPSRFDRAGRWIAPPGSWDDLTPERLLMSKEIRAAIDQAIATLPVLQRRVIILRDLEGLSSHDVCNILNVSETNQRVLLHRARAKIRRALEQQLG